MNQLNESDVQNALQQRLVREEAGRRATDGLMRTARTLRWIGWGCALVPIVGIYFEFCLDMSCNCLTDLIRYIIDVCAALECINTIDERYLIECTCLCFTDSYCPSFALIINNIFIGE